MNHFSVARYITADMSDYESEPTAEQEHQLLCIEQAMKHLNEAYRAINVMPMHHAWPDVIRDVLDGLTAQMGDLDQAQSAIFDEINERDDAYEIAQLRNDERRGDD